MKVILTTLAASVMLASAANAAVLVGFYDFGTGNNAHMLSSDPAAPASASLVTGAVYGASGNRGAWSSTDNTYGPSDVIGNTDVNAAMAILANGVPLHIVITNNAAGDITLGAFVFDLTAINATTGPNEIYLSYASGDLNVTDGTAINSLIGVNALGAAGNTLDWHDLSWSLDGLADQQLAAGESATFQLVAANATNAGQALGVDNIAITGTVVPEPASLAMGLVGLTLVAARRRR